MDMCLYLHECDDNSEVDLRYSGRRIPASGGGHLHPGSTLPHLWEPSVWVLQDSHIPLWPRTSSWA